MGPDTWWGEVDSVLAQTQDPPNKNQPQNSRVGITGTVHRTQGPVLGLTGKLKDLPIRLSSPVPSWG